MDPLSLGVGGIIFIMGAAAGRVRRGGPKPPKPAVLNCGCGHNYGAHKDADRCQAQVKRANQWNYTGTSATHWVWVQCPCQSYDGPEPLPRAWTPQQIRGHENDR
jgi:hypothetical protein